MLASSRSVSVKSVKNSRLSHPFCIRLLAYWGHLIRCIISSTVCGLDFYLTRIQNHGTSYCSAKWQVKIVNYFTFCSVFLCTDRVLPAFVGYRANQRTWKYVQDSCLVMQSLELQPDEKGHPDNKGCQIRSQSSSHLRQPSPMSQGVGLTCSWVVISNRNDTKQHYIVPNSSLWW